jgi:acyl-CoA thioester hydrolase
MSRVKIEMPAAFNFTAIIPIRITDVNYGGHVGNDSVLSLIHEARMQFLNKFGFTEMNCAGAGLIMSDAAIEFKKEFFYGDILLVHVTAYNFSKVSFDFFYKLEKETEGKSITLALAKTGMVCYDYDVKKIIPVPEAVKQRLQTI